MQGVRAVAGSRCDPCMVLPRLDSWRSVRYRMVLTLQDGLVRRAKHLCSATHAGGEFCRFQMCVQRGLRSSGTRDVQNSNAHPRSPPCCTHDASQRRVEATMQSRLSFSVISKPNFHCVATNQPDLGRSFSSCGAARMEMSRCVDTHMCTYTQPQGLAPGCQRNDSLWLFSPSVLFTKQAPRLSRA